MRRITSTLAALASTLALPLAFTACSDSPSASPTLLAPGQASHDVAATACVFLTTGATMQLTASCTTTTSIVVPDGATLDGNGFTITAADPAGGHFTGGVIVNGGGTANVTNVVVTASGLADVCDAGQARLRGILFTGASGSISHSTITGINQGASGCQEGNAVEVRNFGDNTATSVVDIAHDVITGYQKTGIVCNGAASCSIHENTIGASATQGNLAANSVQFGFGSTGTLDNNAITGNSWRTDPNWSATAVLIYQSNGVHVGSNRIGGNSDVGIDAEADHLVIEKNKLTDTGPDGAYDIGIGNWGANNAVTKNSVSGFQVPYDGATGGKNRVRPPHPAS